MSTFFTETIFLRNKQFSEEKKVLRLFKNIELCKTKPLIAGRFFSSQFSHLGETAIKILDHRLKLKELLQVECRDPFLWSVNLFLGTGPSSSKQSKATWVPNTPADQGWRASKRQNHFRKSTELLNVNDQKLQPSTRDINSAEVSSWHTTAPLC